MIILAWIIQILITVISSASILITFLPEYRNSTTIILLITIIAAGVYLCKIPLVSAIYHSKKKMWQIIFLIALIVICISEFETYITLQEMAFNERIGNNKQKIEMFWLRNGIITFVAILAAPIISFIGYRLKNKKK